jgi:hypothetical protein
MKKPGKSGIPSSSDVHQRLTTNFCFHWAFRQNKSKRPGVGAEGKSLPRSNRQVSANHFPAFGSDFILIGENHRRRRDVTVSLSACDADCAGADPVALTNLLSAGRPMTAFHFFNRHWLKVRSLPCGQVKSVGRDWPGAAMQKHASSPTHFRSPC